MKMSDLHPDTFELTMQIVLGWRLDHPNRTIYYRLVNTFRAYAPSIDKVISVLLAVIADKASDMDVYKNDHDYVRECKEVIEVNQEILNLIPNISKKRYEQIAEQEQKLREIDERFEKRKNEARLFDQQNMV